MNRPRTASLELVELIIGISLLATPCFAAGPDLCSASSTVSDVQFTLALRTGSATFQAGEIIPLSLSFTSTAKNRYWADDRNYDRSGRLGIEHYCLDPTASDPLQSYFSAGAFIGGGLGSTRELGATPFTAQADLNEYLTPAPGHYRLYAVSYRVWRPPDPREETPWGRVSEIVRSNTIEFDIKPASSEWQREQLRNALAVLANPAKPTIVPNPDDPGKRAARQLRFLITRDSTRQLAHLFSGRDSDQPNGWELVFGLYGSPFRQLAIDSMRQEFAVPDHPISQDFLETIVKLEISADHAWDIPEAFSSETPPDQKTVNAYWQSRNSHEHELAKIEIEDTLAALPRKAGRARTLTALGLLNASGQDSKLSPAIAEELRIALIASWKDLSADTQDQLIQYRWPLVASPEMLPILLRVVAQKPPSARTMQAMTRDAALKHIFELDPATARPLILHDLQNPGAEPSLATLKLLPPGDIAPAIQPAIDRIAQHNSRELDFDLLDSFADASVLAPVQAAFEQNLGKWACAPQTSMLRYFLRVAPEYGASQVAASLKARKDTHCYASLLQSLGDQLPHTEQSAIEALDDPDPELVQDAVIALARWGTSAAEEPLWARLERFHHEWSNHQDELRSAPDYRSPGARAVALEQALVSALVTGPGWICPPDKLARLQELTLTASAREQIRIDLDFWKQGLFRINPNWSPDQDTTFNLLSSALLTEDQLRVKIAQFPRGTRFSWQFWPPGHIYPPVSMDKQEAAYESMRAVAEQHGITIEKVDDP